jgi:cysteine-rich repeat protein
MTKTCRTIIPRVARTVWLASLFGAALSTIFSAVGVAHAGPVFGPPAALNAAAADPLAASDSPAQIVSDGAGTWVATWQAHDSTGYHIVTARSADNGLSWSAPVPRVAHNSAQSPHLATDKAGTWILVVEGGGVIRSTDNGLTWSDPIPQPVRVTSKAAATSIATNGVGTWIAGVVRGAPLHKASIVRSLDAGLTWGFPVDLNPDPLDGLGVSTVPELLSLGGGVWLATWETSEPLGGTIGSDYDAVYSRSTDDGVTWTPPAPLSAAAFTDGANDHDGSASATSDGNGNVVAVWWSTGNFGGTGTEGDILVVRSSDNGATWSAATALNSDAVGDAATDFAPVVATDGLGTWVTIWWAYGAGEDAIRLAQSTDGGATWSAASTLYASPRSSFGAIVAYGDGQWLASWVSDTGYDGPLAPGPHSLVTLADHPCGNGVVDAGETCDDGNRYPGDCCASTCTFEPATSACGRDADVCTFDRCNATGVCEHVLEPRLGCRPPVAGGKSTLQFRAGADPTNRRLVWKSSAAAEQLWEFNNFLFFVEGLPIVPDVAMCVYDAAGLVMRATPQGSVFCGSKPCWVGGKSIRYSDRPATADGLERIDIQRMLDGGKAQVKGRGAGLPLPPLPIANLPLTVQLGTADGGCWGATYSSPQKNTGSQFKAKSD